MKAEFVREKDLDVLHLLCIVRQRFLFCLTWNWQLAQFQRHDKARLANIFRALFCCFRLGRFHCLYFNSLFLSFERWQRCMKLVPRNPLGLVHRPRGPRASVSSQACQYLPPTFSVQNLASMNINLKCFKIYVQRLAEGLNDGCVLSSLGRLGLLPRSAPDGRMAIQEIPNSNWERRSSTVDLLSLGKSNPV